MGFGTRVNLSRGKTEAASHFAELDSLVIGVAVTAMHTVVAHVHVGSFFAIAQLHSTHTTHKAGDVVVQPEALYDHGSAPAKLLVAVRTLLLSRDT